MKAVCRKPISSWLCVVVPAILILSALSHAQDAVTSEIDRYINDEMQVQKIPGVSLAVISNGKPLMIKGYGVANVEHQVPVKPETIFQSGSVGKQFTAAAVMMLAEEGKIDLDEKIGRYLGEVPETWSGITVRHLLSHTGGMTGYPDDFNFRLDYTEDELLKRAKEIPLGFKAGDKWQYSNLGYVVLGILIHKVSGKFYGDFLKERIFKPLGMTTARVIGEADIIPHRAAGYRLMKGEVKNQEWVSPSINTTADGSLYLSVLDMIKWDAALTSGKLLKKASFDQMWAPTKLNDGNTHPYGFGWAVRKVNGLRVIEHGGAWQGFKAHIARYPDSKLTVILFANLSQTNQSKLAHKVAALVRPELTPKPMPDPDPAFTSKTKDLFLAVLEDKADMTRFTSEVQNELTANKDRIIAFVKTMGTMKGIQLIEREEIIGAVRYRYQVEYSGMTLFLAMTVNKDGKISSFALHPE